MGVIATDDFDRPNGLLAGSTTTTGEKVYELQGYGGASGWATLDNKAASGTGYAMHSAVIPVDATTAPVVVSATVTPMAGKVVGLIIGPGGSGGYGLGSAVLFASCGVPSFGELRNRLIIAYSYGGWLGAYIPDPEVSSWPGSDIVPGVPINISLMLDPANDMITAMLDDVIIYEGAPWVDIGPQPWKAGLASFGNNMGTSTIDNFTLSTAIPRSKGVALVTIETSSTVSTIGPTNAISVPNAVTIASNSYSEHYQRRITGTASVVVRSAGRIMDPLANPVICADNFDRSDSSTKPLAGTILPSGGGRTWNLLGGSTGWNTYQGYVTGSTVGNPLSIIATPITGPGPYTVTADITCPTTGSDGNIGIFIGPSGSSGGPTGVGLVVQRGVWAGSQFGITLALIKANGVSNGGYTSLGAPAGVSGGSTFAASLTVNPVTSMVTVKVNGVQIYNGVPFTMGALPWHVGLLSYGYYVYSARLDNFEVSAPKMEDRPFSPIGVFTSCITDMIVDSRTATGLSPVGVACPSRSKTKGVLVLPSQITTQSLVAWYRSDSLSPGQIVAGSSWADSSGKSNHLTSFAGTTSFSNMRYAGTNDVSAPRKKKYLRNYTGGFQTPNSVEMPTGDFTFFGMIRNFTNPTSGTLLNGYGTGTAQIRINSGKIEIRKTGSAAIQISSIKLDNSSWDSSVGGEGRWEPVIVRFIAKGSSVRFDIANKIETFNVGGDVEFTTQGNTLGAEYNAVNYLNGFIAEMGMFNVALNDADIDVLKEYLTTTFISEPMSPVNISTTSSVRSISTVTGVALGTISSSSKGFTTVSQITTPITIESMGKGKGPSGTFTHDWISELDGPFIYPPGMYVDTVIVPPGGVATGSLRWPDGVGNNANIRVTLPLTLVADGEVSFWFRVHAESGYDGIIFDIDGIPQTTGDSEYSQGRWTGEPREWTLLTVPVSAGDHIFGWEFYTDGSYIVSPNTIWIAALEISGVAPPVPVGPPPSCISSVVIESSSDVDLGQDRSRIVISTSSVAIPISIMYGNAPVSIVVTGVGGHDEVIEAYTGEPTDILIPIILTGIIDPIHPEPVPPVDFDGLPDPRVAPIVTKSDTSSGNLPPGDYRYAYSAWVDSEGQPTAPSPWSEIISLTTDDTVTLTYPVVPGAKGYIVYREEV